MDFRSVRLIPADVRRLVGFYELVTGVPARWATEQFAEMVLPSCTLAIGSDATVSLFGEGVAEPAANRTAILEFLVDDVDEEAARLGDAGLELVQAPTTMPWGNRSMLLRDPDGSLVNLFTPVGEDARRRFER